MKKYILLLIALTVSLSSCKKYSVEKQNATDDELIKQYLTAHSITATKDASGLYYEIITPGTGDKPSASSYVNVDYVGTKLDGSVFDAATFIEELSGLIQGWKIGIPKIAAGGEIKLYVPSSLAYGHTGYAAIPSDTVLIFDIKLNAFSN